MHKLCRLDEIADGASKAFDIDGFAGFLVRKGSQVFGYRNSCPHVGAPLDFRPDDFLNEDGSLIRCAVHGALFDIETGSCVWGPCPGEHLEALTTVIKEGEVLLDADVSDI